MHNKRVYLYDNLKCFLIVCVVLGHLIDYSGLIRYDGTFKGVFIFIYSFHMPLFFYISGLFFKADSVKHKTAEYIAIWIFMSLGKLVIGWLKYGEASDVFFNISGPQWFIFVLAVYYQLTWLIRKLNAKAVLAVSVILSCTAGYVFHQKDFLALLRITAFYPFYFAGVKTERESLERIAKNRSSKLISIVIITVWLGFCAFDTDIVYRLRYLFTGRTPYSLMKYGFAQFGGAYRLLCLVISSLLCFALICLTYDKKLKFVSEMGRRTLQIYFWHKPLIMLLLLLPFTDSIMHSDTILRSAFLLLCLPITALLSLKPFEFPTKQLAELTALLKKFKEKSKAVDKK